MNIEQLKAMMELIAAKVHDAWWEGKKKNGYHAPDDCPTVSCDRCHADMVPYNMLSDKIKEYDRVTVRTVLKAIEDLEKEG